MFEKLKEIKRNICRKINRWFYTPERIYHYLESGTYHVIDKDNNGIKVEFELIDKFDQEDMQLFESEEKGCSDIDIIGVTIVFDSDDIYIAYSLEAIEKDLFDLNPLLVWSEIIDMGKHEGFHAKQYIYIIRKAGLDGVEQVRKYMQQVDYEENVIELGAYTYQFWGKEQDFEKELDPIINGEYNFEKYTDNVAVA